MPAVPIPTAPIEIDWVSGAFMMVRSVVLDEIGLLDEELLSLLRGDRPHPARQARGLELLARAREAASCTW